MQPDYVAFESKQREEFLSQIGNFTPGERDVFHKLCQNWQPRIPYERFSRLLNTEGGGTTSDLTSLMTKLRKDGWGVLRTSLSEGTRVRAEIVLTPQNSAGFFSELLDEFFLDMYESIVNPIPLASTVEKNYGAVPESVLERVPADQLATIMLEVDAAEGDAEGDGDQKPLAIQSLNNESLLVTRKHVRAFISVAMQKMRYYLSNTTLLGLLAKLQDTSLIALKKGCSGKDPLVWLALTTTIISHTKEIEALRNVNIDADFYHVAWLLKNLIESQRAEADEKKRRQAEEELDLEAIAHAVKEAPDGLLEQAELTRIIDSQAEKYGDRLDEFREKFYQRYVKDKTQAKLPQIVLLGKRYIHIDNLFPLFLEKFRSVETELRPYFVHLMEQQLRSGNRQRQNTFFSVENFEEAILEQVRQRSAFLADIIKKPGVLAEAMIHHLKRNKLVKDVTELKQKLALYFDPETMKPLPLHQWFNLRLVAIFEHAFERLPIWQRIWIRITGKYESFRGRFVGQSVTKATSFTSKQQATHRERVKESTESRRSADRSSRRRDRPTTSSPRKSARSIPSKTAAAREKKGYNPKQVDSAWEQFGSTIKKKD